eukprot:8235382-Pyramimonas_sp.AAC.1
MAQSQKAPEPLPRMALHSQVGEYGAAPLGGPRLAAPPARLAFSSRPEGLWALALVAKSRPQARRDNRDAAALRARGGGREARERLPLVALEVAIPVGLESGGCD